MLTKKCKYTQIIKILKTQLDETLWFKIAEWIWMNTSTITTQS